MPSMMASMNTAPNRRQKPARGPVALPVSWYAPVDMTLPFVDPDTERTPGTLNPRVTGVQL
jgi:hypothetical protein